MPKTSTISILTKKRGNALRRAEMVGRALERLTDHRQWINAYHRRRQYLSTVARLTLAIEAVRLVEEKQVRVLDSLAT